MLGKAFHQHSSQHQGATSMAAPAVHSMHTPGACQYPCTTMEKKTTKGQLCDFFNVSLWPSFFQNDDQTNGFVSFAVSSFMHDRSFCSSTECSKKPRNNEDRLRTQIKSIINVFPFHLLIYISLSLHWSSYSKEISKELL